MKKVLLLAALALLFISGKSQVTLFSENFETGGASFTLNTTDQGCVTDVSGYNKWIVNNVYAGGSGSLTCLGFPFGYTIVNSAPQPGGVTNGPNSYYMHILSDEAEIDGIYCASYLAADGFCFFSQSHFSKMSTDISTVGYTDVSMDFYWMCGGSPNGYGQVYYSTDAGNSWTHVTTPYANYSGQMTWQQTNISIPQFDNVPTLRFGFKFVNNQTTLAADPSFCIDEIEITGIIPNTITTGVINPLTYCPGDPISVPYTISGTFTPGNVFKIELSDPAGNFFSPIIIGSLVSTTSGTVSGNIPALISAGTGYRVRIASTTPIIIGNDNGSDITINLGGEAGNATAQSDSICQGDSTFIFLTGSAGNIQWQNSVNGILFNNMAGQNNDTLSTGIIPALRYYRAIVTNPCGPDTSNLVIVDVLSGPVAGTLVAFPDSVCTGDVTTLTLSGGTGTLTWESSTDGVNFSGIPGGLSPFTTTPLMTTTYFRAVSTQPFCSGAYSNIVVVIVVSLPVPSFIFSAIGLDVDFTNSSTGAISFDWDFGDGNNSTQVNPSHTYATDGIYVVTLTAFNSLGCQEIFADTLSLITGIESVNDLPHFQIYPNPSSGEISITFENFSQGNICIQLLDPVGREVRELLNEIVPPGKFERMFLIQEDLQKGLFFLQLKTPNGISGLPLLVR